MNRRGVLTTALACVAAGAALAGCGDSDMASAALLGYYIGPESRQLTVVYGARPGDRPGVAEVLEQQPTHVTIRVRYERSREPQDDVLQRKRVVATLSTPLGDRKVLDEAGAEVPRQPSDGG